MPAHRAYSHVWSVTTNEPDSNSDRHPEPNRFGHRVPLLEPCTTPSPVHLLVPVFEHFEANSQHLDSSDYIIRRCTFRQVERRDERGEHTVQVTPSSGGKV